MAMILPLPAALDVFWNTVSRGGLKW
jgi:hypothetical protein